MRTVDFRRDSMIREYAVLQLKRGGRWHRISLLLAEWMLADGWARMKPLNSVAGVASGQRTRGVEPSR